MGFLIKSAHIYALKLHSNAVFDQNRSYLIKIMIILPAICRYRSKLIIFDLKLIKITHFEQFYDK